MRQHWPRLLSNMAAQIERVGRLCPEACHMLAHQCQAMFERERDNVSEFALHSTRVRSKSGRGIVTRRSMREIARHYTLISDDLEIVGRRRGDATRLGFAMLLLTMRWLDRALEATSPAASMSRSRSLAAGRDKPTAAAPCVMLPGINDG